MLNNSMISSVVGKSIGKDGVKVASNITVDHVEEITFDGSPSSCIGVLKDEGVLVERNNNQLQDLPEISVRANEQDPGVVLTLDQNGSIAGLVNGAGMAKFMVIESAQPFTIDLNRQVSFHLTEASLRTFARSRIKGDSSIMSPFIVQQTVVQ